MTEKLETAPLVDHLAELKKRLFYSLIALAVSFVFCYANAENIYSFLLRPLTKIYQGETRKVIYTGLTEAFFTYLKLSLSAAFFISFPFIVSQIYIFLAPALYKHEKKLLLPYLIATPLLFLSGAIIVYYFIFPVAWKFFLSFEQTGNSSSLPIQLEAKISEYLTLATHMILAFGIAFQLPIVLTLLVRIGLINVNSLVENRKWAIIVIFAVAAILTPPDAISQIGLAIPMLLLYEISIITCKKINTQKMKK
jgi:sec-independent protein translocase protein TatC